MKLLKVDAMDRVLAHDSDREGWLAARRDVITATEVKRLALASQSSEDARRREIETLVAEKLESKSLPDNIYFAYGRQREPHILNRLTAEHGITPAGFLIAAAGNPRHAATPDGWGYDFDHGFVICEIKTSKNAVFAGKPVFDRMGYFYQMQWQMYCVGADRCLYVVETHDNDFSRWDKRNPGSWLPETGPTPAPVLKTQAEPLVTAWVLRDDAVIADLVKYADEFLAALDAARSAPAESEPEPVSDVLRQAEIDAAAYIERWARIAAAKKQLAAEEAELKRLGFELAQSTGLSKASTDFGSFSFKPESVKKVREVDEGAAAAAFPDLHAALVKAQEAWDEVLPGFVVEREEQVPASAGFRVKTS